MRNAYHDNVVDFVINADGIGNALIYMINALKCHIKS